MILCDPRLTRLADAASALLFGHDDDRSRAAVAFMDQLFRDISGIREDTVDPRREKTMANVYVEARPKGFQTGICFRTTQTVQRTQGRELALHHPGDCFHGVSILRRHSLILH